MPRETLTFGAFLYEDFFGSLIAISMKKAPLLTAVLLLFLAAELPAADPPAPPATQVTNRAENPVAKPSPKDRAARFEPEVAKLESAPSPSPGGILMVGSSIFRKWTSFAEDFAPLPVTNRAFGGSRTVDQLEFYERIVPTSKAKLVVWYCGSNDVNGAEAPSVIIGRTREWIERTRRSLPDARILLVSVMRAPQKRDKGVLQQVDDVNTGLREMASGIPGVSYVDVNPAFEDPNGDPVTACYVGDRLHLTPEGYRRMASILKPAMEKEWVASPRIKAKSQTPP